MNGLVKAMSIDDRFPKPIRRIPETNFADEED